MGTRVIYISFLTFFTLQNCFFCFLWNRRFYNGIKFKNQMYYYLFCFFSLSVGIILIKYCFMFNFCFIIFSLASFLRFFKFFWWYFFANDYPLIYSSRGWLLVKEWYITLWFGMKSQNPITIPVGNFCQVWATGGSSLWGILRLWLMNDKIIFAWLRSASRSWWCTSQSVFLKLPHLLFAFGNDRYAKLSSKITFYTELNTVPPIYISEYQKIRSNS